MALLGEIRFLFTTFPLNESTSWEDAMRGKKESGGKIFYNKSSISFFRKSPNQFFLRTRKKTFQKVDRGQVSALSIRKDEKKAKNGKNFHRKEGFFFNVD